MRGSLRVKEGGEKKIEKWEGRKEEKSNSAEEIESKEKKKENRFQMERKAKEVKE